jgi:hypothetical protein
MAMPQPEFRDGAWWYRQPDGSVLRWDAATETWVAGGPETPGPVAESEPWEPLGGCAKAVRILLYVAAGLAVLAAVSDAFEISLLSRIENGETVSDGEVTFNDARQGIIGLVQFAVFFATVVVFLMWFSRAYRNVERLGAHPLRYKPGWAIGAWFVPILNLFRPKQIANDIWRGSDPELPDRPDPVDWRGGRIPFLLFGLWWWLWLIANWAGTAAFRASDDSVAALKTGSIAYLISDSLTALAALLCAIVVMRITRRQEERARRHAVTAAG